MKTIRNQVFETNSSSCHCMTLLTDEDVVNMKANKAVLVYRNSIYSDNDEVTQADLMNAEQLTEFAKKFSKDYESNKEIFDKAINMIFSEDRSELYDFVEDNDSVLYDFIGRIDLEFNLDSYECKLNGSRPNTIARNINGMNVYAISYVKYC